MELTQSFIDTLQKGLVLNSKEKSYFEVKENAGRGTIEGYASTYDLDLGGDRVIPGAFTQTIKSFKENPVMLFSHNSAMPIGSWTDLVEDKKGLNVKGEINLKTTLGRDTFELIKGNDLKGLSIGYENKKSNVDPTTGVNNLIEIKLWEISVVAIPMNQGSWIMGAKLFNGGDPKEPKLKHKDDGLSKEDVAIDMVRLFGAREGIPNVKTQEQKEAIYKDLIKHYGALGMRLPETPGDLHIQFDKTYLSDVTFFNDELFIFEKENLKNNVVSIGNICSHWKTEERDLPQEIDGSVKEMLLEINKDITESNPIVDEEPDLSTTGKAIEEIQGKIDKIINGPQDFTKKLNALFEEKLKGKTGKE